jgi:3-deoxy-manno-octulosonate cytidylyltransferase (CMP-KDO synthetase)
LVTGTQLQALAKLVQGDCPMATLCTPFKRIVDFYNTNQVKVVMSSASAEASADRHTKRALYFSRSRMPYSRDLGLTIDDAWVLANPCFKHLGLYAYKADFLEKFVRMAPGQLEQIEKLEQLRVLENGYPIAIDVTDDATIGVDTPEDAKKFEALLELG